MFACTAKKYYYTMKLDICKVSTMSRPNYKNNHNFEPVAILL